jgi:Protein-disulfide isomerase
VIRSIYVNRRRILASMAAIPAVALLAASGSDEANAQTTAAVNAPAASGSVDEAKLMEPGALPDQVIGDANAPVTIVEYASMTCPHCASFHEHTFPALDDKYIKTGKVKFILREFPLDPRAEAGFMLARCSDNKYYPMVDVLFKQQMNWAAVQDARTALLNIAKLAGFTQESFEACLTDQKLLDDVRAVRAKGAELGVTATPTFFINGKKYSGAMSIEQMSAIIDPLL